MKLIETVACTYYLIGLALIGAIMLIERTLPKPAWKWLLVPRLGLVWPWVILNHVRDGSRRP